MSQSATDILKHLFHKNTTKISHAEAIKNSQKIIASDHSKFQQAMSSVHCMIYGVESDFQKAAVYDYTIWSIGRNIAAEGYSNLMLGNYVQENRDIAYSFFPNVSEAHGPRQIVDLAKCNAYTGCWSYDRIPTCIDSLFKNGYKQPSDSNGVYYPELHFAVMYNGRHHTSWAVFLDDCHVLLDTIYLTPYFKFIDTDGAFYYFQDEWGNSNRIRVNDFRMAVLFQLAKERSELSLPYTVDAYKSARSK